MELIAVLVAFGALVISLVAVYLTNLRPAEIAIDHSPRDDELPLERFSGPHPEDHSLLLGVFVSNAGARGGLLESVRIVNVKTVSEGEPFWTGVHQYDLIRERDRSSGSLLPLALQAGAVYSAFLWVVLVPDTFSPEGQARRIGLMDGIDLTVAWRFARTTGLPFTSRWLPPLLRQRREHCDRSQRFVVLTDDYGTRCIKHWRAHEEYGPLAVIAIAARGGE